MKKAIAFPLAFLAICGAMAFGYPALAGPPAIDGNTNMGGTAITALTAPSYTATAAANTPAFVQITNARLCMDGATCSRYIYYDGTNLHTNGALVVSGSVTASSVLPDSGNSGSLTKMTSGTLVIDFASTGAGVCVVSAAVTVTGAALGDSCTVGISADMSAILGSFTCDITGAGTAKVVFCSGAAAQDPASATYTVRAYH